MKIHEYQGKALLKQFGVAVPRGIPAFSVDEAVAAAQELGGSVWVVKAQISRAVRVLGKVEPIFVAEISDMAQAVLDFVRDGDVVLVMGAGSISRIPAQLGEMA